MKDFAIYNYKEPMNRRGETCLDQFRKNSDREWAQRFFMLNLECWKYWIELANKHSDTKGSKKILKNADYLNKYKIKLPAEDLYYWEYQPAAAPAPNSAVPVPRSVDNQPSRQNDPTQNRGNPQPNRQPANSGRTQNSRVYQEAEVRSAIKTVKDLVQETSTMFTPLTEFPDYLADVLELSIGQFNNSNSIFQAVIGNPAKYPVGLVEEVTHLVNCVEPALRAINDFETSKVSFDQLKQVWSRSSNGLAQSKQSSLAVPNRSDRQDRNDRSGLAPSQAARQEDQPITNIDMNSYMSAAMNQKIKREEEGEGDDDLRLPDHFSPEEDEYPKPSQKPKPNNDFDDLEDDEEEDFGPGRPGKQLPDPNAPKEFEDEEYNQVDDFEDDLPDIRDKPDPKQSGISLGSKEPSRKSKPDSRPEKFEFKFQEDFDEEEVDNEKEQHSPPPQQKPQPPALKPQTVASRHPSASNSNSHLKFDPTPKHTPKQDKTNEMHFSMAGSHAKLEENDDFELPGDHAHNQLEDDLDEDTPKPAPHNGKEQNNIITEEEKIKLAIKNQKVLTDPKAQNVLNDFFTKQPEPQSSLFDPNDVFARAKLKLKKPQEPVQSVPVKPKGKTVQEPPPARPAPVEAKPHKQEPIPEPNFSVKPSSSKTSLNQQQPKPTDYFNEPISDPFNLNNEGKIQTKIPDSNLPAEMNDKENGEDGFFDTDEFFKDEGHKTGHSHDVAAGFANGWGEPEGGYRAGGNAEQNDDEQFQDAMEFDDQTQKELEEYLKERNNQNRITHNPEPQTPNLEEEEKNYLAPQKGGLLDDAEPEYFAPPNLEKMREEILRVEQVRIAREAQEKALQERQKSEALASQPKPAPTPKNAHHEPTPPKKLDIATMASIHKPAQPKQDPFEKYQAPASSQLKKQNPSISQDNGRPLRRQGTGQNNISQFSDNFQKSDFFNDYGSPDKLNAISAALRHNQQVVRRMNDEEHFFQPSDINSVKPSNELPVESREAAEIKQENERLKRENFILSNEKKVLDKKLEEVMNGTVKKLKEELALNGSQTMSVKLNLLENDLKLADSEKSMYMQKYKELYTKYKTEKESEKDTAGLLDPKKILELSQLTVTFAHEKQALQEQLAEERQKTVYLDSLKDELDRTKAELQSRTRAQLQMDVSNALAGSNSAILAPIKDHLREPPSRQSNMFHQPSADLRQQAHATFNHSRSEESQQLARQRDSNLPLHEQPGKLHEVPVQGHPEFLASHLPISRVSAGVDDIGLFDESDMDFLANFHKEFDQAVSKIKKSEPYKFTSINPKDTRSSFNAIDNEYDFARHTVPLHKLHNARPSVGGMDRFDRSFELELRNSTKERNQLSHYSTYQPVRPATEFGSRPALAQGLLNQLQRRHGLRSTSNSEERYERGSLGRMSRNQPKPQPRANPMLEPFNKIYDEIPLPNRFASSYQPAGMRDSGISELKINPMFFQKDPQQPHPAHPGRLSTISQPEVQKHAPHYESHMMGADGNARNGRHSQISEPVVKPPVSFPTHREPTPREVQKPAGPLYPSLTVLNSENVLNFRAASVFDKGILYLAKKKFEVSCSSIKRSSPQDPIAAFEITIKALSPNLGLKAQLVQKNSNFQLMQAPTASLLR